MTWTGPCICFAFSLCVALQSLTVNSSAVLFLLFSFTLKQTYCRGGYLNFAKMWGYTQNVWTNWCVFVRINSYRQVSVSVIKGAVKLLSTFVSGLGFRARNVAYSRCWNWNSVCLMATTLLVCFSFCPDHRYNWKVNAFFGHFFQDPKVKVNLLINLKFYDR